MLDTCTGDLLAVAEDALCAPSHLTPQELGGWYSHTLRDRLPLIREALRVAREEGDTELATQLIDQAVRDHPAATATAAPAPRPHPDAGSEGNELPVPERVLCALLHRHWTMTVEGAPPHQRYVAYRPIGWSGQRDPFERITAPTRTELLRLLAHRHLGLNRTGESGDPEPPPA